VIGEDLAAPSAFRLWHLAQSRSDDRRLATLWSSAGLAVCLITGLGSWWAFRHALPLPAAVSAPPPAAISIDLAPAPQPTPTPPQDVAPGPQQTAAPPQPEPDAPPRVEAPPVPAPHPPVPVPKATHSRKLTQKVTAHAPPVPPLPAATATATSAPPGTTTATRSASAADASPASQPSHDPITWQGALLARLERFKRYPAEAQADHQEGTAMLHFVMDRRGHVLSASLTHGAGYERLDRETLELIRRAEPLPAPPDTIPGEHLSLTVPIEFYLEQH
jgi:periplasmic protein TonB